MLTALPVNRILCQCYNPQKSLVVPFVAHTWFATGVSNTNILVLLLPELCTLPYKLIRQQLAASSFTMSGVTCSTPPISYICSPIKVILSLHSQIFDTFPVVQLLYS